jgi:hypothetical protein
MTTNATPKPDHRKAYPMGTSATVAIDAETDHPQTERRGREFHEIVRDVMLDARATLEQRLTDAGYPTRVKIGDMSCDAWFPANVVKRDDAS